MSHTDMYIYNIYYYYYDFNDAFKCAHIPKHYIGAHITQIYHKALLMTFINILLRHDDKSAHVVRIISLINGNEKFFKTFL